MGLYKGKEEKMTREELEEFYRFAIGRITSLECDVNAAEKENMQMRAWLNKYLSNGVGYEPSYGEIKEISAIVFAEVQGEAAE